jgi:DNA-binding beta-propeller fold protein YncE
MDRKFANGIILAAMVIWSGSDVIPSVRGLDAKPERDKITVKEKHRFDRVPPTPVVAGGNVVFSPDGKLIAWRENEHIYVRDVATGEKKLSIDCNSPYGLVHFPSGSEHLSAITTGLIKRVNVPKGTEDAFVEYRGIFLSYFPDGKHFVCALKKEIEIRDSQSAKRIRSFSIDPKVFTPWEIVLSPDGKFLAVSCHLDKTVKVWRVESGELVTELKGHQKQIAGISFSPSGKTIATASLDETLKIWNTKNGEIVRTIKLPERGLQVAYSPDGKSLAVSWVGRKSQISIHDAESGDELARWQTESNNARKLAFNPKSNLLASTGGRFIQVWEISTNKDQSPDKK